MEENGITADQKISLIDFYLDDIKQMKNRQWQVAYYFLLLIAAIIGILKGVKIFNESEKLKNILFLFTIVLGICGTFLLHKTQISLKTYRERLRKIYFEMPDEFRNLWGPLGNVERYNSLYVPLELKKKNVLDLRESTMWTLRMITGQDFGKNPKKWRRWWEQNKGDF